MSQQFEHNLLLAIGASNTAAELCRALVESVLAVDGLKAAILCELLGTSKLEVVAEHGLRIGPGFPKLSMWSSDALYSSINLGEAANVLLQDDFHANKDFLDGHEGVQFGVVCSPVWSNGVPIGGLQLVFDRYPNKHVISYGYLQLICTAFEKYLPNSKIEWPELQNN
jgi:hypothetical protein